MKEELVHYEQALVLKELGFDEPCFAQYKKYDNGEATLDIGFSKNEIISKFDNLILFCSSPTFSQAFRWFREKHNLDSFVKHLYSQTVKVGYYFGIDEYKGKEYQSEHFKTYEEAELECLKKLIELCKKV